MTRVPKDRTNSFIAVEPPLKNKPYLFLDFDGVLNNHSYSKGMPGHKWLLDPFDTTNIKALNVLIASIAPNIVISSAWRHFGFYDMYINEALENAGFRGRIVGHLGPRRSGSFQNIRGIDIQAWLINNKKERVPFVIIDDTNNMGHLYTSLVLIDPVVGFVLDDVQRVMNKLGELYNES